MVQVRKVNDGVARVVKQKPEDETSTYIINCIMNSTQKVNNSANNSKANPQELTPEERFVKDATELYFKYNEPCLVDKLNYTAEESSSKATSSVNDHNVNVSKDIVQKYPEDAAKYAFHEGQHFIDNLHEMCLPDGINRFVKAFKDRADYINGLEYVKKMPERSFWTDKKIFGFIDKSWFFDKPVDMEKHTALGERLKNTGEIDVENVHENFDPVVKEHGQVDPNSPEGKIAEKQLEFTRTNEDTLPFDACEQDYSSLAKVFYAAKYYNIFGSNPVEGPAIEAERGEFFEQHKQEITQAINKLKASINKRQETLETIQTVNSDFKQVHEETNSTFETRAAMVEAAQAEELKKQIGAINPGIIKPDKLRTNKELEDILYILQTHPDFDPDEMDNLAQQVKAIKQDADTELKTKNELEFMLKNK